MPTAVLMGMGLTPRLAQADELPKNPFKGDRCVSQSDSASPQDSPSATASATPSPSASTTPPAAARPATGQDGTAQQKSATSGGTATNSTATPTPSATPAPTATPSATASTNPLDPLGLGSAINGLVHTITGTGSSSPTPSATPTSSASRSATSGTRSTGGDPAGAVRRAVQGATGKVTGTATGATRAAASAVPSLTSSPTPSASATDGGQGYPCPTYNPQALADANLEQTTPLPNTPWILKTDLLTLTGLDYHGVVKVRTENGTVKDVLKFTATGVDIHNLHQITDGPDGTKFHVQARQGSTSTIRNGTVTMYTEELKGNLFGLIPVSFTPKSPPPLNVPAAFFTNVTVTQAGQFGGTLTVPGMHLYRGD